VTSRSRHRFLVVALLACWLAPGPARAVPPAKLSPLVPPQTARIDAEVAAFPASDDRAHVFFLGFAAFGEQKVFSEEIQFAARQVDARFATAPRTLLLINDRRDLERWPMATYANLRYALLALGRVMNPERDVLFVALASHGGSNGLLEVSNVNLEPSGLGGERLAEWLDAAGITQRIVAVSACHAGAFLRPLATNRTIVLTASRHDRTSFGCADDRDLTYFGEAFYRDALPGAPSLRLAFERASSLIRDRESQLRGGHSMPQSYFGPVLETRLPALMRPAPRAAAAP